MHKAILILNIIFLPYFQIERYTIKTNVEHIDIGFKAKILTISDLHLGVYKGPKFLARVVKKINSIPDADALVIPGDFIYHPEELDVASLRALFEPLQDVRIPVYAIYGNHDSQKPGPPIEKELREALEELGVIFLFNEASTLSTKGGPVTILGLGDRWAKQDKIELIKDYSPKDKLIVLTHNPDTVLRYDNEISERVDITICGHTHAGQIRVPGLYKKVIPTSGNFDRGLYDLKQGKVFITSGVGETGLPIRLGVPPEIAILMFE